MKSNRKYTFIDKVKICKIFFKKYFFQIIKDSKHELYYKLGIMLKICAGIMLFFFSILGLMLNATAFYLYVLIMSSFAFTGIILSLKYKEGT